MGSPGTGTIKKEVLKHPILNMVAEKLGKSPAQVALRWGLQMGHSVLPKSTNETRIRENFDVFDWSIPEELFAKFAEIEQVSFLPSFRGRITLVSDSEYVGFGCSLDYVVLVLCLPGEADQRQRIRS